MFRFEVLAETICVYAKEDRLWIADPKALNYILQKSGYLYAKPANFQELSALVTDRGVIWAEGELPTMHHAPCVTVAYF